MFIAKGLGSQRRAFVFGAIAIKVPRLHRLREGSRANREERRVWREGWQRQYPELCPIFASLPFGIAVVMPAARMMTGNEFEAFQLSPLYADHYDHYPKPDLYEDKAGDWGWLKGRPVVVDYALRAETRPLTRVCSRSRMPFARTCLRYHGCSERKPPGRAAALSAGASILE